MIMQIIKTLLYSSTLSSFCQFQCSGHIGTSLNFAQVVQYPKKRRTREMRLNCQPPRLVILPSIQYIFQPTETRDQVRQSFHQRQWHHILINCHLKHSCFSRFWQQTPTPPPGLSQGLNLVVWDSYESRGCMLQQPNWLTLLPFFIPKLSITLSES